NNFSSRVKQSFTTYQNDLVQDKTIFENANQKLGYMFLYSYANANSIFPSIPSIATAICASERTAMRVVQDLERLGFIEVKRTKGKSNIYILNDYYEVVEVFLTSDKLSPVSECHEGSDKLSPVLVTDCHTKTNNLKLKNKKKNSSSTNRDSIDIKLKEKYQNIPTEEFNRIKENMLNDERLDTKTDNQYKGLLEYRLKNWKPAPPKKKTNKRMNIIRTEEVPEWIKDKEPKQAEKELIATDEDTETKKAELLKQWADYKRKEGIVD
ncbi:helix-turn-helix domain-containing protein, partial [Peribacillus simplex]|uniref:helix-turn-helix domain-containing protein n=1 Tax=Peribacillus simplex TaxID=1478 RepID=UPI003D040A74